MLPLPGLMSLFCSLIPSWSCCWKSPVASKIWNLQWTSSISKENEFKASFPFQITDASSIFPVQLQGCSCTLGWDLRFLLGAAAGAGLGARGCSSSTAESMSLPALWAGGWVETRKTSAGRKGQITKTTKKLRRRKIFQTCENTCQTLLEKSLALLFFSVLLFGLHFLLLFMLSELLGLFVTENTCLFTVWRLFVF